MADKLFTTYWTELAAAALAHADAVGIEDTGGLFTAENVEAALAEVKGIADSATQPGDLATVATTGAYSDLSGTPTLGTAAAAATGDFEAAGAVATHTGDTVDAHDASAISIADAGTLFVAETVEAALAEVKGIADSATQPGDLATVATTGAYSDLSGTPTLGNAAGLTVDADLATLALPASTTISTFGASLVDDATAGDARTTLELGTMATATATDYQTKASFPGSVSVALSDMTTQITTGATKAYWVNPYDTTLTITKVRATLATAGSGSTVVDINEGAGVGTSILSTAITIDASTTDSDAAGTPPVVSDASIAADGRLTFDIDTAGTNAAGLLVHLAFTRSV